MLAIRHDEAGGSSLHHDPTAGTRQAVPGKLKRLNFKYRETTLPCPLEVLSSYPNPTYIIHEFNLNINYQPSPLEPFQPPVSSPLASYYSHLHIMQPSGYSHSYFCWNRPHLQSYGQRVHNEVQTGFETILSSLFLYTSISLQLQGNDNHNSLVESDQLYES